MEKKKKTKNKKRFTWVNLAQLLTVAALLLWMQWAVDSGRVLTIFVASPTSIVEEGIKIITDGTLWPHLLLTIQEALAGYLSAVVVGIAVGLIWTLFPVSEKYMNVFCSAIMAVPKVAILPLLILWFGIGFQSKAFLVFLFSVFTILYNTVTGAKECKKEYLKVAKVFKANRSQTVFLVIIPAALPSIFNGLKLAAATALTGKSRTWLSVDRVPEPVEHPEDVLPDHPDHLIIRRCGKTDRCHRICHQLSMETCISK